MTFKALKVSAQSQSEFLLQSKKNKIYHTFKFLYINERPLPLPHEKKAEPLKTAVFMKVTLGVPCKCSLLPIFSFSKVNHSNVFIQQIYSECRP